MKNEDIEVKETILVIGGCRSGKSRYALDLAENISETKRGFIATCVPYDEEMKGRVLRHQKERGLGWTTIECPIELGNTIVAQSQSAGVLLVDCLTLWMSNLLMESEDPAYRVDHLTTAISHAKCSVIIVSNEVGTGIVPENALARRYRDEVGFANQKVAACVDKVIWMVAGIPVTVKG